MIIDPENQIKELFALFGAAYYHSECLHRGLCNLYAIGSFKSKDHITTPRLEEKLARAYKLTLGQLVQEIQPLVPTNVHSKLQEALERRNFLAHQFWFERIHLVYSEQGIALLTQELQDALDLFTMIDSHITAVLDPIAKDIGLNEEALQESLEEVLAGEDDKLTSQRPLRKQETIIRAWDVPVQDGRLALVFETDDHELWQLCDVGLGWTYFDGPQSDWIPNQRLQSYLPTTINPRPAITIPWQYEFQLHKTAVLWVKPGRVARSFAWGIRTQ